MKNFITVFGLLKDDTIFTDTGWLVPLSIDGMAKTYGYFLLKELPSKKYKILNCLLVK